MLKQKKKSEPGGSLVKHLLAVTQKRKPATGEVVQSRGEETIFKNVIYRIPTNKFYFVLSSAS